MRRLTLLLVALAVALAGARLLHADDVATAVAMRDAAVLFTAAALLFALSAIRPAIRRPQAVSRTWPAPGRVLTLTGLGSAALGGLLFGVSDAGTLVTVSRLTLWLLGLLLLCVGVWWPGTVKRYSLPGFRWQQGPDGEFTRVPVRERDKVARATADTRLPFQRVWLAAVIAGGVLLRAWPMVRDPATCVANECVAALGLVNSSTAAPAAGFNLIHQLAQMFNLVALGPLLSVRLAALAVGVATLLLVWPSVRRLASPAMGVVVVALLAFNPHHIAAGRWASPWLPVPLFALGALWALHRGQHTGERRDWTLAGLALGLWALTAPALLPGVLLLAVCAMLIGISRRGEWIDVLRPTPMLLSAGAFFVTVLPVVAIHGPELLRFVAPVQGLGATSDLWSSLAVALTVLGLGSALRYARLSEAATIATACVVLAATAWWTRLDAPDAILVLLAPGLLAAALAVDALCEALVVSWRVLVRPSRLAVGFALTLLIPLIWVGARGVAPNAAVGLGEAGPGVRAMIAAASEALTANAGANAAAEDGGPLVVYLPEATLATAEAQIALGPWIEQGRVQPLALATVLDGVGQSQRVFLPPAARDWADVLRAYFPRSVDVPEFDPETGTLLYWVMAIAPEPEDGPGVTAVYVDRAVDIEAATRREPSLDIELPPDLPDDLDAGWRGSLRVDTAGSYRFDVIGLGPDDVFTLLLDDKLVLDTSLARPVGIEVLAAGVHGLEARLRTTARPPRVTVRWGPVDGQLAAIPGAALFARPLPALGLEATYFANANFQPPGVDLRRDLFLATAPIELPAGIVWQGKMAANRAGEYLLGIVADGDAEILLDDVPLVSNASASGEGGAPGYAEGTAYLDAGWHDLAVRFAPAAATSTLSLLWQPPGGLPTALSPLYLRPHEGTLTVQDEPLPAPPALTDPRLERDGFALTQGVELRRPQTVRLADNLPPLLGQVAWEANGGCGPGLTQLSQPHGVAIDPVSGRVYVADTGNARVAIFTPDGVRLGDIVDPILQEPVDVAVAADGAVFVLDAGTQQVLQLDHGNGTLEPLTGGATFYRPRGLAALENGLLAVADTGGARVVLVDRSGAQVIDFGGLGTALGRGQPVDVLEADGVLWAVTSEDGRLWHLDVNGSVVATQQAVSVDGPHLAAALDGGLFVSDPMGATVRYHAAGGRPLRSFAYPDAFVKPTGVAAAVAGNEILLYVVDTGKCSVSAWRLPVGVLE